MSDEKNKEETPVLGPKENIVEINPSEYVLTDEMRAKALQKPVFNILYVGDGDSRLAPFRGESMIRTFASFYERHAEISYSTMSSTMFAKLKAADLKNINVLWIDNISGYLPVRTLSDIITEMKNEIEPKWKERISKVFEKNKDDAKEETDKLDKKRTEKLRIIYALDEFVWEGVVGRSRDIGTVQLMETCMSLADTVVVPNPELKESITHYGLVADPDKEIYVIPSSVSADFFPLFKNFSKKGKSEIKQLSDKPKVLIKGIAIPKNIEEFITKYYKKVEITVCSVDEVNDHVKGLFQLGKINHIQHWANPYVHKANLAPTYSIERDSGFDFVIHTKPDNLKGNLYEITTGDEDILFSISYGALPIAGVEHLGYDKKSAHLATASGLTFGNDTNAKKIFSMIERYQGTMLFNEAFGKCRAMVENRISTSSIIISRYFAIMLGRDVAKARAALSKEKQVEMEKAEEKAQAEKSPDMEAPTVKLTDEDKAKAEKAVVSNVVEGNFGK